MLRATGAYQADSDAVGRFLRDECEVGPHIHAPARQLFGAWQSWAIRDGAETLSEKAFAAELDRLGHESRKTSRGMVRVGVRLLDSGTDTDGSAG